MAKLDELKKQNPALAPIVLDVLTDCFTKSKYVDLTLNLLKGLNKKHESDIYSIKDNIERRFQLPLEMLENKSFIELCIIDNLFGIISENNLLGSISFPLEYCCKRSDLSE